MNTPPPSPSAFLHPLPSESQIKTTFLENALTAIPEQRAKHSIQDFALHAFTLINNIQHNRSCSCPQNKKQRCSQGTRTPIRLSIDCARKALLSSSLLQDVNPIPLIQLYKETLLAFHIPLSKSLQYFLLPSDKDKADYYHHADSELSEKVANATLNLTLLATLIALGYLLYKNSHPTSNSQS